MPWLSSPPAETGYIRLLTDEIGTPCRGDLLPWVAKSRAQDAGPITLRSEPAFTYGTRALFCGPLLPLADNRA
jgi:hypothetical protein